MAFIDENTAKAVKAVKAAKNYKSEYRLIQEALKKAEKLQRAQSAGDRVQALNAGDLGPAINKVVETAINDAKTIGDKISDALNTSSDSKTNRSRYGSGRSVVGSSVNTGYDSYLDMLHAEQERIWNREDTAYQRTVKDLQAAGLNPVLAVSGGMSPVGGSSSSSDSQVVGAVAELAGMAISGLTETAKGVSNLAAISSLDNDKKTSFISKAGSFYKKNASTIRTAVSTAATLAKLFA